MRFWTAFLVLLASCGPSIPGEEDLTGDGGPITGQPDARLTASGDAAAPKACEKMDILFVIDDSGSMAEEQDNLATNFPLFIDVIHNYEITTGELLDYHVAATTTGRDMHFYVPTGLDPPWPESVEHNYSGANGELLMGDGCGMPRRWLERSDGTAAEIADTFACVAEVGTEGPGIEMPFYTTQLAFTTQAAVNEGFLRQDALLAMVILTDEDDCSRADNDFTLSSDSCDPEWPENISIDSQLQFLDTLKDVRGRWAAAVIAGPGPGTCSSDFGDALEARRLEQFVAAAGANAVFSSICDGDLASSLADALDTFDAACDSFPPIP